MITDWKSLNEWARVVRSIEVYWSISKEMSGEKRLTHAYILWMSKWIKRELYFIIK